MGTTVGRCKRLFFKLTLRESSKTLGHQVERFVTPFPGVSLPDITTELHKQNYTILDMYKMAEGFFTSMGLPKMTEYIHIYSKNRLFTLSYHTIISLLPTT